MLKRILLPTALLSCAIFFTGCATHVGYRAHDRVYSDYHVWGPQETTYYNQWVTETHRHEKDYRRLKRDDQRQYWQWRHSHGDNSGNRRGDRR